MYYRSFWIIIIVKYHYFSFFINVTIINFNSLVLYIHQSPIVSPHETSAAEPVCFLWCTHKQTFEQTEVLSVIWGCNLLNVTSL